jgi:hypothetical protein
MPRYAARTRSAGAQKADTPPARHLGHLGIAPPAAGDRGAVCQIAATGWMLSARDRIAAAHRADGGAPGRNGKTCSAWRRAIGSPGRRRWPRTRVAFCVGRPLANCAASSPGGGEPTRGRRDRWNHGPPARHCTPAEPMDRFATPERFFPRARQSVAFCAHRSESIRASVGAEWPQKSSFRS